MICTQCGQALVDLVYVGTVCVECLNKSARRPVVMHCGIACAEIKGSGTIVECPTCGTRFQVLRASS